MSSHGLPIRCPCCAGPIDNNGLWARFTVVNPGNWLMAECDMGSQSLAVFRPESEASNASLIGHQNTLATFAANASFGSSSTGLPISASKHVTSTLSNGFRDLGSGPNYAQTGPNGTFDDIGVLSSSGSESLEQVDTNGSGPHQSALLSRIDNIAIPGTSYAHSNDNGVSANQDADFANSQANTCAHCGQQFRRIPDLNRHVKSHDPAKLVHKCSVQGCNYKGSYRKDKLTEHMKKRHGIMSA